MTPGLEKNMFKDKSEEIFNNMGDINTIIGKGTSFEGNISVENSVRVDGRFKGNIKSAASIVVGKEGEIEGEISVKNAVIGGKITGKLFASGKVTLENTSSFRGELTATRLVIDEGAILNGTCTMPAGAASPKPAFAAKKEELAPAEKK